MKHARACISLVFAATVIGGCATRPPAPERPYLVQIAAAGFDGPCDWSLLQDVNVRSVDHSMGLGAAYWPHTVPAMPARWGRRASVPLQAFGASTSFRWPPRQGERLCLTLHKRTSAFQEGVPPILMLEVAASPVGGTIHTQSSSPTIAAAAVVMQPARPGPDFSSRRIDVALRDGRAESGFTLPSDASRLHVTVVATEAGGKAQTERALELLTTAEVGGSRIVRNGSKLVARPSWP